MLLIWEECYCESIPCSSLLRFRGIESLELAFEDWEARWVSAELRTPQVGVQVEDKVGSLINKMMMGIRVNVVGEGLVGRLHLLVTICGFIHTTMWEKLIHQSCSQVQNEVCQQFSSGMKTVAVIPVLPQGVVQLGSSLAIFPE